MIPRGRKLQSRKCKHKTARVSPKLDFIYHFSARVNNGLGPYKLYDIAKSVCVLRFLKWRRNKNTLSYTVDWTYHSNGSFYRRHYSESSSRAEPVETLILVLCVVALERLGFSRLSAPQSTVIAWSSKTQSYLLSDWFDVPRKKCDNGRITRGLVWSWL